MPAWAALAPLAETWLRLIPNARQRVLVCQPVCYALGGAIAIYSAVSPLHLVNDFPNLVRPEAYRRLSRLWRTQGTCAGRTDVEQFQPCLSRWNLRSKVGRDAEPAGCDVGSRTARQRYGDVVSCDRVWRAQNRFRFFL